MVKMFQFGEAINNILPERHQINQKYLKEAILDPIKKY